MMCSGVKAFQPSAGLLALYQLPGLAGVQFVTPKFKLQLSLNIQDLHVNLLICMASSISAP
jgi:hypothetical protein